MRPTNNLDNIENQIMTLPVSEQILLIERIARRVRTIQATGETNLNWSDLYGSSS